MEFIICMYNFTRTAQFQASWDIVIYIRLSSFENDPIQSGSHTQIPYLQQCKVKSRNQGT